MHYNADEMENFEDWGGRQVRCGVEVRTEWFEGVLTYSIYQVHRGNQRHNSSETVLSRSVRLV